MFMPLGHKVKRNIENIIREEMDAIDSQELVMPCLLPEEVYISSGRRANFGNSMFSLKDRKEPFIIAEMSGNHNHSLERALEIVDAAADAGVDALKLQTYTADTMTLDIDEGEFHIGDPTSLWAGESLYSLYQKAYTPWEWHKPIFDRCKERGIIGFSTPFDLTAVDFLAKLHVTFYQIASFENIDMPLLRRTAQTWNPNIPTTGMEHVPELDDLAPKNE